MHFTLPFLQRIYRIGLYVVILLILLDITAFFYYPETLFGDIFLATREQTPLTWFSALSMFFLAISSFAIYTHSHKKTWYALAVIFLFFSIDDATYLHERVSGAIVDNTTILGFFPSYIWVVLYAPLLLFALVTLISLLWKNSSTHTKKIIIIAIVLLGSAIFLDLLDGFVGKNDAIVLCFDTFCQSAVLHMMRLTEEVFEVIALGMLGYITIKKHLTVKNA